MNLKNYKYLAFLFLGISILGTSCFKDLDTIPLDPDEVTSESVYDDPNAYKQVLAKIYAGLALTGQQGPDGQADIGGIDEGFGQYLRAFWYHQELPTDESVIGWNDQTIKDFHEQDWTADDNFIFAFYSRIFYQVALGNEFLRQTEESKLNDRGVDAALKAEIQIFRAEARYLRALSYWHALDHFRNVPFVTEVDAVGAFFPEQTNATDLYNYIESELLAIESELVAARSNEYGRADQAAAWMLLSKLYLNAEVYVNKDAYNDCITYCDKILNAGYNLEPEYAHLFLADNHNSNEIIFPVTFDGINTRTWGGMTFIIHAGVGGNMDVVASGIDNGWGGTRVTSALVDKFPSIVGTTGGGLLVAPQTGEEHPEIYVPGSYTTWNFSLANKISSPNADDVYEGYIHFPDENTSFKITLENNFSTNYGDTDGDGILDAGGSNLVAAEAGFYFIKADLNDLSYSVEKTTWGVIGSATPNGWDADQDMTYNEETGAWEIDLVLQEGDIKFRANDDWALNFGDDFANALLDFDGGNIIIPQAGTYTIQLFLDKPDYTYSIESNTVDSRALFYTDGQNLEIADIAQFTEGYASIKFKNISSNGQLGSDLTFPDTDFPMFRLADVHLMYAEAVLRGGAGDAGRALDLVNQVRFRAYGEPAGNITQAQLTLDFLLDERARELHWECHRRTDLVRFDQLTNGTYLWPWKGGVSEGTTVDEKFNIYPIPSADLGANPNLSQNPGY